VTDPHLDDEQLSLLLDGLEIDGRAHMEDEACTRCRDRLAALQGARDAEHLGDLGVVETDEVAEDDGGADVRSQPAEGDVDVCPVGHRLDEGGRIDGADVEGVEGLVLPGFRAPAPAAELVEARVGRHPVRPGGEGGTAVEARQASDNGDHRLLQGVGGVGVVAHDPPAHGVEPVGVAPEQQVERAAIAGVDRRHELRVVPPVLDGRRVATARRRSRGPRRGCRPRAA
jgi:hypothetical protein